MKRLELRSPGWRLDGPAPSRSALGPSRTLPALSLEAHVERAARLGHSFLRPSASGRPPLPLPSAAPASSLQRTLGVQTVDGRERYQGWGEIGRHVSAGIYDRTRIVNLLFYWGELDEERHFDSWESAIDQADRALDELWRSERKKEIFGLLKKKEFGARDVGELRRLLAVEPERLHSDDLSPTDVRAIDVKTDKVAVPVIDLRADPPQQEPPTVDFVHPIFSDVVGAAGAFLVVILPEDADAKFFTERFVYNEKRYRLDLIAGSSLKPGPGKTGRAFGIEETVCAKLEKLLGFEEAVYYAQRALFPLVKAGVQGGVRSRAYPQEPGMQHVFRLQDGTPVQVDDGWGYIKKSLADQMGPDPKEKRKPKAESGRASHQMLSWFDDEDLDVVNELVRQGLAHWNAAVDQHRATENAPKSEEHFESRRVLKSLLTTGKPPMEMAVAMPVTGSDLVVPRDEGRYTRHLPGEASVIRSPADKQNFYPLPKERIDRRSKVSRLVGEIEGIQYTLTGHQDNQLTFFKGMVGVIPDELWPHDWQGVDLVVSAKDRKLYEKWERDSSLEEDPIPAADPEKDRAAMRRMRQDFTVHGTLAAVQWFEKGSFVGVPPAIQKWLGGDYDGDEVAMVFGARNPALQAYVRDRAFREEEVNPKLTKSFTYKRGESRAERIIALRSPNVGVWSNLAAQVRSLPIELRAGLARETKEGRLLGRDRALDELDETERMEKEIQLGIKVGTDGYKTSVDVRAFERRASRYMELLQGVVRPISHDKRLLEILKVAGTFPTLGESLWADAFFRYDEVDIETGEYVVRGVSARVLRHMIWNLLPPEDRRLVETYRQGWKKSEGFDPRRRRVPNRTFSLASIDRYTRDFAGTALAIFQRIDLGAVRDLDDFTLHFLVVRLGLSNHPKRFQYVQRQQGREDWVAGLRPLLKRLYLA